MIETKIEENQVQEKVLKKKIVSKNKTKLSQNTSKNMLEMVWYASILF